MSVDEMLAQHFSASADNFRDMRRKDAEFDSICNDFLELTNRFAASFTREDNLKLRHLADVAETISSLAEEIKERLDQCEPANSAGPKPP